MTIEGQQDDDVGDLLNRFPPNSNVETADQNNAAIKLYGRRFYKDQTPVEYLAEFLLVFVSEKGERQADANSLRIGDLDDAMCYWPKDKVALKLFSFFPSSKLETRHFAHQQAYGQALDTIKSRISGSDDEKEQAIRLLQSLFSGFVGVARNRTWVTHSFLPASPSLLAREVAWLHTQASRDPNVSDWQAAKTYFAKDRHNFMARGGEVLFLQQANLFSASEHATVNEMIARPEYAHLRNRNLIELRIRMEAGLRSILEGSVGPVSELAQFIENTLEDYNIGLPQTKATLGWVPSASVTEAFLFACELDNICRSSLGEFEKLDQLQLLCCLQVLRSHCFQASRFDRTDKCMPGFIGNYTWVVANPNAQRGSRIKKLATNSFERVEEMLYRVLRKVTKLPGNSISSFSESDKHGFQIFRKISKEIGLVVPRTGRGQHFVLPPTILRFLVGALLGPGERVRLTHFYERVFSHFGIALSDQQLGVSLEWDTGGSIGRDYSAVANTTWVEETLRQGGLLVELSDAVSIVHNPGKSEAEL
jgi:hypothetical protein